MQTGVHHVAIVVFWVKLVFSPGGANVVDSRLHWSSFVNIIHTELIFKTAYKNKWLDPRPDPDSRPPRERDLTTSHLLPTAQ